MVMGNRWNEAVELFRGVLVISIIIWLATIFIPPQQLLNILITGLIMALIIALATAITLILIIREYKKSETEW
jgi:uncharacterized phage infection (PIP) family protein YhgE